jgi:hypothetical protein
MAGYRQTELHRDGVLTVTCPLETLEWMEKGELYPYVLLELPTSLFRFASILYKEKAPNTLEVVLADMALMDLGGRKLRPHSPKSIEHRLHPGASCQGPAEKDLMWEEPMAFKPKEVLEKPDHCAFRLVRRVYEAFGFKEANIPCEYDRSLGRLVIPQ